MGKQAHAKSGDRALRTAAAAGRLLGVGLLAAAGTWPLPVRASDAALEPLDEAGRRTVDVRLWAGGAETRFGAGLGLTRAPWALAGDTSRRSLVIGVRHRLGSATGVYADAAQPLRERWHQGLQDGLSDDVPSAPRVRVGLEFKRAPSQFAGLRQGSLLRLQLSADANLSLRPRRGGMLITYRAQF